MLFNIHKLLINSYIRSKTCKDGHKCAVENVGTCTWQYNKQIFLNRKYYINVIYRYGYTAIRQQGYLVENLIFFVTNAEPIQS